MAFGRSSLDKSSLLARSVKKTVCDCISFQLNYAQTIGFIGIIELRLEF